MDIERETAPNTVKIAAPSWQTAARIYTAVLENHNAPDASRDSAAAELIRMAELLDGLVDQINRGALVEAEDE